MKMFFGALILALALEGACLALFPRQCQEALLALASLGEGSLRRIGFWVLLLALVLLGIVDRCF